MIESMFDALRRWALRGEIERLRDLAEKAAEAARRADEAAARATAAEILAYRRVTSEYKVAFNQIVARLTPDELEVDDLKPEVLADRIVCRIRGLVEGNNSRSKTIANLHGQLKEMRRLLRDAGHETNIPTLG